MPITTVVKSIYPIVPRSKGIPAMLRGGAQILDTSTLGFLGIGKLLNQIIGEPPVSWGVFNGDGKKIADYDSVFALGYSNESRVSDYPVEQGAFASYNKVDNPFEIVVTLTCGGSEDRRSQFMSDIEDARQSLQGYTVLTPEYTYRNVNFVGISTQRTSREGATLLSVQLTGREIRETTSAEHSDTKEQGMIQTVDDTGLDVSGMV